VNRVLALSYSQTGQTARALDSLVGGLDPVDFSVTREAIRPRETYPFPWTLGRFLEVFPDCVLERPPEIDAPPPDADGGFDLVVLAYQVWFLAPSLPVQAFLRSPWAARVLRGKPLVALCICRNMWHRASDVLKRMVADVGGVLVDHVVVTDRSPAWASFVTTPRWMLTGRRNAFWVFPPAGVSEEDLRALARFGRAVSERWAEHERTPCAPLLGGLGAVQVDRRTIVPELLGRASFPPLARLVARSGPPGSVRRYVSTGLFVIYLVVAIVVLIPLVVVAGLPLHPLFRSRLAAYVERLRAPSSTANSGPAGAGSHRSRRQATRMNGSSR